MAGVKGGVPEWRGLKEGSRNGGVKGGVPEWRG